MNSNNMEKDIYNIAIVSKDGEVTNDEMTHELMNDQSVGGSKRGTLFVSYVKLLETFGRPNEAYDHYKSDVNFSVMTPVGLAHIYNWKDGKNNCGDEGLELVDINEWSVGGKDGQVMIYIERALGI